MEPNPRFSLVIPAHNEEDYLPALLDTVDAARAQYRNGPDAIEVIVADNVSTDRTAEIAESRGCRIVTVEKRVIAAARNGGARVAKGEIVAFIDADSRIHPETFNVIEDLLADGRFIGGATGLRMERWSPGLAVTYLLILVFVWTSRMDAGVVFCRREDFQAIGGYREHMFFAEDVRFLWDLRTLGRSRGQRLVRARAAKAISSARKFDKHGDWHYLTNFFRSGYLFLRDRDALHEWGQDYWYRDRSG